MRRAPFPSLGIGAVGLTALLAFAEPSSAELFHFDAGNFPYGWTLASVSVDCGGPSLCTPVFSNLTGMFWDGRTNYPTAVGSDPLVGDARGSIRLDTSPLGDGVPTTGDYWHALIMSPDLSADVAWQDIKGFRAEAIASMGPGPLYAIWSCRSTTTPR